jgi:hypothetical protein
MVAKRQDGECGNTEVLAELQSPIDVHFRDRNVAWVPRGTVCRHAGRMMEDFQEVGKNEN